MNNNTPITLKVINLLKPLQFAESFTGKYTISSLISRHFSNGENANKLQKQFKFSIAFENSSYHG